MRKNMLKIYCVYTHGKMALFNPGKIILKKNRVVGRGIKKMVDKKNKNTKQNQ